MAPRKHAGSAKRPGGRTTRLLIGVGAVIVLAAVAGVIVALSSGHSKAVAPTTTASTTTTTIPIAPLTGLVDPSGESLKRPALTVKVENTPDARPLWGVDQADVVYEEIVNGGITRLAAIFNSQVPAKIGPVRSVRPTDAQVVWPLGGLFAYSGGAQYAIDAISQAPVTLIDETGAKAAMFRDPTRSAPHNLYAVGAGLFLFGGTPIPPPALFSYSSSSPLLSSTTTTAKPKKKSATTTTAAAKPTPVSSMVVGFPAGYAVTWSWNPTSSSWDRSIFGAPDVTGTKVRLSPKNVVVLFITYQGGIGTESSVGILTGSGPAQIYREGRLTRGTWSRPVVSQVTVLRDSAGKVIPLTPGQTWVELLDSSESVTTTP
jgi:hypothetical protein